MRIFFIGKLATHHHEISYKNDIDLLNTINDLIKTSTNIMAKIFDRQQGWNEQGWNGQMADHEIKKNTFGEDHFTASLEDLISENAAELEDMDRFFNPNHWNTNTRLDDVKKLEIVITPTSAHFRLWNIYHPPSCNLKVWYILRVKYWRSQKTMNYATHLKCLHITSLLPHNVSRWILQTTEPSLSNHSAIITRWPH